MKLPLEVVGAILEGDVDACRAVVLFVSDDVAWSFCDMCHWRDMHERQCFVDATPQQIGFVCPGRESVAIRLSEELPIYVAEYVAALSAVISVSEEPVTVFTDNIGVFFNLHKGRCPRAFFVLMCQIFRYRAFSVEFIPSNMNPDDVPSRAPLP